MIMVLENIKPSSPKKNHHQTHLHLENNPYPAGHPRSYGECPRMSYLLGI